MITAISWKNVWRNRSRSLIVIGAVTLGTISGVFVAGLMKGWVDQRIHAAVYTEVSHIKIQNPEYLNNEEIRYTIPDYAKIEKYLNESESVKAWTKHTKIMAMAGTSRGNTSLMLKGVQPDEEKKVSDLYTKIVEGGGSYFDASFRNPIVISEKTADQLRLINYKVTDNLIDSLSQQGAAEKALTALEDFKGKRFRTEKKFKSALKEVLSEEEIRVHGPVIMKIAKHYKLKSKIVFTFSGVDGEMVYQQFRVAGIFKTANTMFDQMNAFVLNNDLASVAGFSSTDYHEINMIVNEEESEIQAFSENLATTFPSVNVMTWKELAPDAGMMADFMQMYYYIIMGVIFFALAFGIINTMLMAILERIKELGMLMAIGMNKKRVFRMIMLETVFLTLTGSIVGMILGGLTIAITGTIGLNFASVQEGFEAFGWSAMVYPSIELSFFFGVTLMVIVIGILASIVPARKALKLNPVEAIRIE